MPKSSSFNFYSIYSHAFLSKANKEPERQTVCHIMSIPSLILHVWLLCLGGPAIMYSPYLGVQTWETLENLIKMQR